MLHYFILFWGGQSAHTEESNPSVVFLGITISVPYGRVDSLTGDSLFATIVTISCFLGGLIGFLVPCSRGLSMWVSRSGNDGNIFCTMLC